MQHSTRPRLVMAVGIVLLSALASMGTAHGGCVAKPPSDHVHAPGDPAWVGHTEDDLVRGLGEPSFTLSKPIGVTAGPDYEIDVYTVPQPSSPGCVDAYRHNQCGVITEIFCR